MSTENVRCDGCSDSIISLIPKTLIQVHGPWPYTRVMPEVLHHTTKPKAVHATLKLLYSTTKLVGDKQFSIPFLTIVAAQCHQVDS